MKQISCDLCGSNVKTEFSLNPIRNIYQIKDVEEVCDDCLSEINKQLAKIEYQLHTVKKSIFKRFLMRLRLRKQPELEYDTFKMTSQMPSPEIEQPI